MAEVEVVDLSENDKNVISNLSEWFEGKELEAISAQYHVRDGETWARKSEELERKLEIASDIAREVRSHLADRYIG